MPNLYILAGPNGAGKTTTAYTLLPEVLHVREFVNADEIARGLSPFNVEDVAFEAGRIMLNRIEQLMYQHVDFAIETTLSTRSYVQMIQRAKRTGYQVTLIFIYLSSAELAVSRVAKRVSMGGHHIPTDVVHRRYERALMNLFSLYLPICDFFLIVNNSGEEPIEVAKGGILASETIQNLVLWNSLKNKYGNGNKEGGHG
ncbi:MULTISPECIES: zeta toxin family protein [unclassified Spirosoma]|uniref:zeta toxin family protein n=1 Tax=unclassified Spirosoma TaxID=2621999 RepID=UPI000961C6BC|nr:MULTISPECIES: zeta toxin family protein [unclassified Spirosoma]MBN8821762.1 zeta toxin family protein [Spirosoma sp.]OJW80746.1 MAG: zeta toxin [Spirosoma sp. 48-14]